MSSHSITRTEPAIGDDVQPAPFLAKLLSFAREQSQETADAYDDFLLYAERCAATCATSNILVEASYKLAVPFTPITDRPVPRWLEPQEAQSSSSTSAERSSSSLAEHETNTLLMVFNFYSKAKQVNFHQTSFTADDIRDARMSFDQTETFCRDFAVIPKLLSRDDLKLLWEDLAVAHFARGLGELQRADFADFKDLVVRMALWAYHKPGLKKLVITIEGFLPTPANVIRCFCTFLRLHDTEQTMNFLRGISSQTEEDADFRKHGSLSDRAKLEMRIAADVKKVESLQKTTVGKLQSPPASPKTRLNKARNQFNQFKEDWEQLDTQSLANQTMGFRRSVNSYSKTDFFGDKLPTQVRTDAANPRSVVRRPEERETNSANKDSSLRYKVTVSSESERRSLLPESLRERLSPGYGLIVGAALEEEPQTMRVPQTNNQQSLSPRSAVSRQSRSSRSMKEEEKDDDDDSHSFSLDLSKRSRFQDNSIRAMRETMARLYDSRLVRELQPYCRIAPKTMVSDWISSKGPFVDLGLVDGGAKVTIELRVSNGTPDELFIDATARNFRSEDTNILTLAKPLIPGFARILTIEFTVPKNNCTVLCFVDIVNIAVRKGESAFISCPVFYRIDAQATSDRFPRCTAGRLPDLLATKLPDRERKFTASFQQRKALDGSWTNVRTKSLRLAPLQLTATRPKTTS